MNRRIVFAVAGVIVAMVLGLVAYDYLVETDEERLEQFVDEVTGTITSARIENAQARWVDLSRQRIDVSVYGQALAFREGEEEALASEARTRLARVEGSRTREMSSEIVIEGERATVTLEVLSDQLGLAHIEWYLEKHDGDWLVARLVVRRGSLSPLAPSRARG